MTIGQKVAEGNYCSGGDIFSSPDFQVTSYLISNPTSPAVKEIEIPGVKVGSLDTTC